MDSTIFKVQTQKTRQEECSLDDVSRQYQEKHTMAIIKHDGGWMIMFWGSVEHELCPVIICQGSSIRWRLKTSQQADKDGRFCSGNYFLRLNRNILVAIQLHVYTSPVTGVSHTEIFEASTSQIRKIHMQIHMHSYA